MDGLPAAEDAGVGGIKETVEEKYRALAYDTALSTLVAVTVYVVLKVSLDGIRQWRARISVLIVGSGPVGLTAALVAVRTGKVLKLTVLDERYRSALLCRPQQIALDPRSVKFLLGLGVDFDNMEGCWHNEHFFTRIGVFQEYLLSILEQKKQKVEIKVQLGTKVQHCNLMLCVAPALQCLNSQSLRGRYRFEYSVKQPECKSHLTQLIAVMQSYINNT